MNSTRSILRSASLMGSASAISLLCSLFRTKIVALWLGPTGVGIVGLLQSMMSTASAVGLIGLDSAGTRQIAEASGRGDSAAVATTRRALLYGTIALALVSALVIVGLRQTLATYILGDPARGAEAGWMALGVALTIITGANGALLNGLRRVKDLARISVYVAVTSSLLGIASVLTWHEQGIVLLVLLGPTASFVFSALAARRIVAERLQPSQLASIYHQLKQLSRLGVAFMASGLVATGAGLLVRTIVQGQLGENALGQFQAATAISTMSVGFVLNAMSIDYYPRLTAGITDAIRTKTLVDNQTEIAILLSFPILLVLVGGLPWIIPALYSHEFSAAADILRWQLVGDALKIASWPLAFMIPATGNGRLFLICESVTFALFVAIVALTLPVFGVTATGIGYAAMYLAYIVLECMIIRFVTGYRWSGKVAAMIVLFVATIGGASYLAGTSERLAAAVGGLLALVSSAYAVRRLARMSRTA